MFVLRKYKFALSRLHLCCQGHNCKRRSDDNGIALQITPSKAFQSFMPNSEVDVWCPRTSMACSESRGIQPRRAQMRATLTSTGNSFLPSASSSTHATLFLPSPANPNVNHSHDCDHRVLDKCLCISSRSCHPRHVIQGFVRALSRSVELFSNSWHKHHFTLADSHKSPCSYQVVWVMQTSAQCRCNAMP